MFEPGPPLPELPSTPPNQPVELEPQGPPPDVVEEPQVEYDNHGYKIVGRKQVQYDGPKLDAHLDSVFQFWRASGSLTCEYRNGCEWREEKALEAAASFQNGRRASSS
ncbi:hypothetical protein FA13DRAFT_1806648 [Coprinellus micaceus]|uniref:Uncharacterized protein n=1 Tax=Coprinellus micaceus TaxID=71717 RepID=A0A4Y7RKU4_COPMI|nr:hypothetical protein FA13DRAFT_1806648 [Coprinellus micaceus]